MEMSNPFGIFPKEVWEMILDNVENSRDIQNVLRGFPKLDISIDKRKRFWYLDQILRFVCEWVEDGDILNLRLVCKQWEARANSFLQNQPYARAYSHELHKDQLNFWNYICNGKSMLLDSDLRISMYTDISVFEEIMKHPRWRNPLVFRELIISFEGSRRREGRHPAFRNYIKRAYRLLRHSGVHLWNLDFLFEFEQDLFASPVETAMKMLSIVPNLKYLSLAGEESCSDSENFICFLEDGMDLGWNFPELPHLETLIIADLFIGYENFFWMGFLKYYGKQVRRLNIGMVDWIAAFGDFFPSLTELRLGGLYKNPEEVTKMLSSFVCAPNIVKVVVAFGSNSDVEVKVEQNIFEWIKLFPKIKYFGVSVLGKTAFKSVLSGRIHLKEDGTSDPIRDCVPTLENFEILDGTELSYNFLRCFPALRHLLIHYKSWMEGLGTSVDSCVKLREQIQTRKLYESNVWEVMKRLRTLRMVNAFDNDKCYDFDRGTYQKLENAGKVGKEQPDKNNCLNYC